MIENGETVEEGAGEGPYSGRVVLGWVEGRPVHVVVAENETGNETIVVTVYEPDPGRWTDGFTRRRKT